MIATAIVEIVLFDVHCIGILELSGEIVKKLVDSKVSNLTSLLYSCTRYNESPTAHLYIFNYT
jgi:hypothetical protein